jgi:hypothetical protein
MYRSILFAVLPLALVGCGASDQQLRARAAFDLQCPQEQVGVVEVDNRTKGAQGCGRQALYIEDCQPRPFQGMQCTWIMNSDTHGQRGMPPGSTTTPPPPPPPPPAATH